MNELAMIMIAIGTLLLRLGWRGRRAVAAGGWALVLSALTALTLRHGAWGLAIGGVGAIVAALVILLYAGWTSPPKPRRPARAVPSIALPRRWPDIARRLAVFALVVPVAFAAAQWLAFGAQALARRGGAAEADAIVLTLFLQPILWGIIMTVQMTRATVARMIAPPVVAGLCGTLLWVAS